MAPTNDAAGVDLSEFQGPRRMSGRHAGVPKKPIYEEVAAFDAMTSSKLDGMNSASEVAAGLQKRRISGESDQDEDSKKAKGSQTKLGTSAKQSSKKTGASNPAASAEKTLTAGRPQAQRQPTLSMPITKSGTQAKKPVVMSPRKPYVRRPSATKQASADVDERRDSRDRKTEPTQLDESSRASVRRPSSSSIEENIVVSQNVGPALDVAFTQSGGKDGQEGTLAEEPRASVIRQGSTPGADITMADALVASEDAAPEPASPASSLLSDVPSDMLSDIEEAYKASLKPTRKANHVSMQSTAMEDAAEESVVRKPITRRKSPARAQAVNSKATTSFKASLVQTRSGRVVKRKGREGTFGGEMTIPTIADTGKAQDRTISLPTVTNTRKRKAAADESGLPDVPQPSKESARESEIIPAATGKLMVKFAIPSSKSKMPDLFEQLASNETAELPSDNEDQDDEYAGSEAEDASYEETAVKSQTLAAKASRKKSLLEKATAARRKYPAKAPTENKASRARATPTSKTPRPSKIATSTPIAQAPKHRAPDGLFTPPDTQPAIVSDYSEFNIDPRILAISKKLTHREPRATKPLPQGAPEVWADSRQALCETVPYFKMPQSGCHQNDRHVYSFLYDGASRCREYMDTDIIIGGAGGAMEQDSRTGQLVQKQDHLMSESQVQSVLNDIKHENPLIIICGNKSEGAICKMPHRYNVLGWYKPIAVWAEKTVGKGGKVYTTIKYRFERLNAAKKIWHAPTEPLLTDEERGLAITTDLVKQTCSHCSKTHPMVFVSGWMCLTPDCDLFWKLPNGHDAPYDNTLPYNPAFLFDRTPWEDEEEPYSVKPPVLNVGNTIGDNLTGINTRGMCCPECGRCNSRILFKGWKCYNPDCHFENFPKHIPVSVPMLHNPWENIGEGPSLARNKFGGGADVDVTYQHGFKVFRYSFPGVKGTLVHAVSNRKINRLPGGPDEMFATMQDQDKPGMDLHLERRRFGAEKLSADAGKPAPKALQEVAIGGTAQAALSKAPHVQSPTDIPTPLTSRSPNETEQLLEQASASCGGQESDSRGNFAKRTNILSTMPSSREDTAASLRRPATAEELLSDLLTQSSVENLIYSRINIMAASLMQERSLLERHMSGMNVDLIPTQEDTVMLDQHRDPPTQGDTGSMPADFADQLATAAKEVLTSPPVAKDQPKSASRTLAAPKNKSEDGEEEDEQEALAKTKTKDLIEDGDCMTAFSMNYGMPYKFVASGASLPFTDSPWPVRAARADLNWASRTLLDPADHEDLNELLIFAYLEGQKIEYHDDGESGLGPRIATLSLGGKAKMHLRMKMKHYVGCSKTGIFVDERPVPGSICGVVDGKVLTSEETYTHRLAAWEELEALRTTDKAAYTRRSKEIPKELGLFSKRMKKAEDMVTITLNHGDIVLMEGYEIQQYLEHKVVPEQCLRFALTCRTIRTEHLKEEEKPGYVIERDDEQMSSLRKMAEAKAKGKGKEAVRE
jgi:alkylated DNA repair dioxygenase AlkB